MNKITQWVISAIVAILVGVSAWGGLQLLEQHEGLDCAETETITIPVKVGSSTLMQPREVCKD